MGDLVAGSITVSRAVLADLTSAAAQVFNHIGTGRYTRGQVHDLLRGPVDRAQAALDAAALRQEPSVDEVASAIAANIDADIVGDGNIQLSGFKQAAQAIASLYRDKP